MAVGQWDKAVINIAVNVCACSCGSVACSQRLAISMLIAAKFGNLNHILIATVAFIAYACVCVCACVRNGQ